jgi:hypothetical protein
MADDEILTDGTFEDGYLNGWRSVLGEGAPLPSIPSYAIRAGKTEYRHGYDEGRAAAEASALMARKLAPRDFSEDD